MKPYTITAGGTWSQDKINQRLTAQRTLSFRYERYSKTGVLLGEFPGVESCTIDHAAFGDIKRTAKLTIADNPQIDWLNGRIKPYVRLEMGYTSQGVSHVEWPMGLFLMSSPTLQAPDAGSTAVREVEAYDQTVILLNDKVTVRSFYGTSTTVTDMVSAILQSAGVTLVQIIPTTKTLVDSLEFDPGTSKLSIINALLGAINYQSLWFDSNGRAVVAPYEAPGQGTPTWEYIDNSRSVLLPEATKTADIFDVPNQWVLYTSNPESPSLRSVYTNTNPASPTSTVSRGLTIVDVRQVDNVTDQAVLDARAARLAQEASQVYESVEFSTALMPIHEHLDTLLVSYTALGVADTYQEIGWSMDLQVGGDMNHRVRKLVNV